MVLNHYVAVFPVADWWLRTPFSGYEILHEQLLNPEIFNSFLTEWYTFFSTPTDPQRKHISSALDFYFNYKAKFYINLVPKKKFGLILYFKYN